MKGYKLFICSIVLTLCTVGCKQELNEQERDAIVKDIPQKLYLHEASVVGEQLGEYLTDAVDDYAESLRISLQKKINQNNATSALFGGNAFDFGELFGTSTNQIIANQYEEYVNYANRHMADIAEMAEGMTVRLAQHPEFIEKVNNESQEYISLDIFDGLNNIPSVIPGKDLDPGALTLDESNKSYWGEILLGDYKHPKVSVPTILYASIIAVENMTVPKPVYAVYDKDTESWEAGYDSGQAVSVKFSKKGDLVVYEATPIDFHKELIDSKYNVLTDKK
ncbi:MAG: hypothetical protein K2J34_01015 [Muribaculaceae bacterium]|nr:hypothetical protein [Muribaculaceae bacterium]